MISGVHTAINGSGNKAEIAAPETDHAPRLAEKKRDLSRINNHAVFSLFNSRPKVSEYSLCRLPISGKNSDSASTHRTIPRKDTKKVHKKFSTAWVNM